MIVSCPKDIIKGILWFNNIDPQEALQIILYAEKPNYSLFNK